MQQIPGVLWHRGVLFTAPSPHRDDTSLSSGIPDTWTLLMAQKKRVGVRADFDSFDD